MNANLLRRVNWLWKHRHTHDGDDFQEQITVIKQTVEELDDKSLVNGPFIVVAASDASPEVKAAAWKVCDGTDDHTEIDSALDTMAPYNGTVILSEGTFLVDGGEISLTSNIKLVGSGFGTVIKLQAQDLSTLGDFGIIEAYGTQGTPLENILIADLTVDGNKGSHTGTAGLDDDAIDFKWVNHSVVANVQMVDCPSEGIDLDDSEHNVIYGCHAVDCGGTGFHMSHGAKYNRIVGNLAENCGHTHSRYGFDQWDNAPGGQNNLWVGNVAIGNNINYRLNGNDADEPVAWAGNLSLDGTNPDEFTLNQYQIFANLVEVDSDGLLRASSGFDADSNKIVNVTDPTNAQDAATKAYVDGRGLDDLSDVDTAGGSEGDVLTQQADGSFALEATGSSGATVLHGAEPQSDGSLRFRYGVDASGRPTYTAAGTTDTEAIVVLDGGRPVAREVSL